MWQSSLIFGIRGTDGIKQRQAVSLRMADAMPGCPRNIQKCVSSGPWLPLSLPGEGAKPRVRKAITIY